MRKNAFLLLLFWATSMTTTWACTGISFKAKDNSYVVARTIEWGGSDLNSMYVVIPRGHQEVALTPTGQNGLKFQNRYGVVGLAVAQKEFIADGMNEAGLAAGLFYFPGYGSYCEYDSTQNSKTISDLQVVPWMLANFATVDEVIRALDNIRVISINPDGGKASTVHWRIADASGRQVVLEITEGGKAHFFENKVGVLTNSPGFEWQVTNLNNYVNLYPGNAPVKQMGGVTLASFGAGTGFRGIPGDVTPPSRFVRAFFYQTTAPQAATAYDAAMSAFHILNNFDIPIGVEHADQKEMSDLLTATQWTIATDITGRKIYYRTAFNSLIRCIDLTTIKFDKVKYQYAPLDPEKKETIEMIQIKK